MIEKNGAIALALLGVIITCWSQLSGSRFRPDNKLNPLIPKFIFETANDWIIKL